MRHGSCHSACRALLGSLQKTGADFRYLKAVDRHNEWTVSAFLATNGALLVLARPLAWTQARCEGRLTTVKLILLHDGKNDDGIRLFFGEVWEHYVKVSRDQRT